MSKGILASITLLLTAAGLALAGPEGPGTGTPPELPPVSQDAGLRPAPSTLPAPETIAAPKDSAKPKNPSTTQTPASQPSSPNQQQQQQQQQQKSEADLKREREEEKKRELHDCHQGPENLFWVEGDYLLGWTKKGPLHVPLAVNGTTGSAALVLGDTDLDYGTRSGGQVMAGMWLGCQHIWGAEAGGFVLEQPTVHQSATSDATGNPVLTRPILDAVTNLPTSFVVAEPGAFAGSLAVSSRSRFWGLEANLVRNICHDAGFDVDLVFGFRFLDLDENLNIDQNTAVLPGSFVPFPGSPTLMNGGGSSFTIADSFSTRNLFYGGQVGLRGHWAYDMWFLEIQTKVALGPNHELVDVLGSTTLTLPTGQTLTAPGGLLAVPGGNAGHFATNWFTIVPEVGVQVGCKLSEHIKVHAGYSFLYMSDVVRPGDQVSTTVNPRLVPTSSVFGTASGPAQPTTLFRKDDFFAHGVVGGLEICY